MSQTLFTTQTPSGGFLENSAITLATTVVFAVNGQVSGGRFFARATNPGGTYELVLYLPTVEDIGGIGAGTVLASATYPSVTDGVWNSVSFSSPVNVVAGQPYKIALRTSLGSYTATANFFSADLVNGDVKGPQTNVLQPGYGAYYNGSFIESIVTYPNKTFNATCYFVDVAFDAASAGQNLAVNLTATAGMGATLANEVRLSAALTATGGMAASMRVETTLRAALTATAGMGAALSVPSGPVDPIGSPVAMELLTCFTDQLQQLPSPPKYIQLRVGQDTGPLVGANVDECCAGLAWVRIANIYPSWDNFPGPDNDWLPCGPLAYAVVLEMGVAFCMPWSDSDDSFDNQDPPNSTDWATAFTTQMQHQTLMRRAAACCWRPTQRRAVGEWTPLPVEVGCTGGKLLVTVSVMAPCGDC